MAVKFNDADEQEVEQTMMIAWNAFMSYRQKSLKERADFMRKIGSYLDAIADDLVPIAMRETNLGEARLKNELSRTIFQLTSYADACEQGSWVDATIDTADPRRSPPKPDIRKMLVPLGPVAVFGASNFPFAYSTAGGDTACALAAGCSVVVKAHPGHAETSEKVAQAISGAAKECGMPEGVFSHVHGASVEVGKALVLHPNTKAVGFTGSLGGGRALFDWGSQREEPIPVFAEMGSINPVFLFPEKLKQDPSGTAKMLAASVTLSVGQFCTNPGLIIGVKGEDLDVFLQELAKEIEVTVPAKMLHEGIAKSFSERKSAMLAQANVDVVAVAAENPEDYPGVPTIATVSGDQFLENKKLHEEVFGPYSLVVKCSNLEQMSLLADTIEGQLTATLLATDEEITSNMKFVEVIKNKCGRLIMNGVPTGVEVCKSMQHGGPYPATTDSRFTSVGADGIKRFARPICFQNWNDSLLPIELRNENSLGIWRTVNGELIKKTLD